jgi:hypothetical protein
MTMNRDQRRAALRKLLEIALPAVESQPAEHRADLYDGIAAACHGLDATAETAALKTASSLREAQSFQLQLRALLK